MKYKILSRFQTYLITNRNVGRHKGEAMLIEVPMSNEKIRQRPMLPERVCTVLFFGAEIQPKHLVFCYLGFLPGFRWFSAVSPTLCTVVSKKTKLSCFGGFFSLVFKTKQLLGFLGVVYMLK
jgi:hypothetical protein